MSKDAIVEEMRQSEPIQKEKERVLRIVQDDLSRRDQEVNFFRNTTLKDYTEVSIGQFIGHRAKPEWKKDYQYNVFDPITRDKVMAIVSKSAGLYEAQFFNTNKRMQKVGEVISAVLNAFYQDACRRLKEKDKNKDNLLVALIEPKVILFEGWRNQRRTIREITKRDEFGDPSEFKEKKIVHYNGPWNERVPVMDFIPGSLKIRDLTEQPHTTWAAKMQMSAFQRQFPQSRFPDAAKVKPFHVLFDNGLTEYVVRNDLKEQEVEVIRYFDKWEDRMVIIANGVMLNKPNAPMPFAHKEYPFVWGGFEPLHPDFIYDMPLPIKILDMQDMNNEILNLTLDMVWRALQEVWLVKGGDEINDDVLYGGGMVDVDDPQNFQKMEFGSSFAFNSAAQMRDVARRSIESASLDAPASGTSGTRQITAREAVIAREAAMEITSLFLSTMENMERDKAYLRVKNQLDRYQRPIDWKEQIGEELTEKAIPVFREISLRDGKLTNGKRGRINVTITDTPRSKQELNRLNLEDDKTLSQTIDITPEAIRNIEFDVEIVAGSAQKKSKAQQVGEARAFLLDAASMPQVFNVGYAGKEYVKALGKKEDEALLQNEGDPMQSMMQTMAQKPNQPGQPVKSPKEFAPDSIEGILNDAL